jgi:serine/threonine protein kinase
LFIFESNRHKDAVADAPFMSSAPDTPSTADYDVGILIAEGAFAKIFYGRHKATQRAVAIKVVSKVRLTKHPSVLQGLLREQKLLSEPLWSAQTHIVTLLASFHDDQHLYFVLGCATRGNLTDVIANKDKCDQGLWVSAVVPCYMLQLVEALEFIHSQRILHWDLKPDNILVNGEGSLQLTDFASAVELDNEKDHGSAITTTDYSCPEVCLGTIDRKLTTAVDLWSLGCICFALLDESGRSPFHAESDALSVQRIHAYMNHEFELPTVFPEGWNDVTTCLLHRDPGQRLGMCDLDRSSDQSSVRYASIRSIPMLKQAPEKPSYLPPNPTWWNAAQKGDLRDGAKEGWRAFI